MLPVKFCTQNLRTKFVGQSENEIENTEQKTTRKDNYKDPIISY